MIETARQAVASVLDQLPALIGATRSNVGSWGQSRHPAREPEMTQMTDAVEKGLENVAEG
jgi:hypothetical protein